MDRRQTALTWPIPALALALVFATSPSSRTRAQLPEIPAYPPAAPGNAGAPAPVAPVDALPAPEAAKPDPIHGDPRPASRTATPTVRPDRLPTSGGPADAPRDPAVRRTAAPDPAPAPDEKDPLPPSRNRSGAPVGPGPKSEGPVDGYTLPTNLPAGRQAVGLSLEVIAPEVMNIGQTKTVKVIVRNTGVADASAVRVSYNLPKELDFVSAQPEAKQLAEEPGKLSWPLFTVAAGSEQVIALKVKPMKVGSIDHTSAVSLMVGARAHTSIQEPMLRVEQTVSPAKVLKGQQVVFRITVSNPGSGPARNVVVRAKLSSGLRTSSGDEVVEQTIPVLQAQQHVELDSLEVDTIAGGEQTCTVTAESDDVARAPADIKVVRSVTVLRPELALTLQGPETRYTDTLAEYRVTVANPGTAAAKNIRVSLALPASGGKLQKPLPSGAEWNAATQKLSWVIPNLEPTRGNEPSKVTSTIRVRLGGVGMYRIAADAKAGDLFAKDTVNTSVSGMADLDLNVDEKKRVLDVGESTIFDIKMKNLGTKDAKNLNISAELNNVEVTETAGTDAEAVFDDKTGRLRFPLIESLAPGRELNLHIGVKAIKPGAAKCKVTVLHDDLKDPEALEDTATARVTPDLRAR